MYDIWPNATVGFHGCDRSIAQKLVNNPDEIKISREKYDWLGHGMYFWENNVERAWTWAENKMRRGAIKDPAVIGAVLHLGHCCNLLDSKYIQLLKLYFDIMANRYLQFEKPMPSNKDLTGDEHNDKILRTLDCAVIQFMHNEIWNQVKSEEKGKGYSIFKLFDSVRGAFTEGGPVFPGAGILEKTHIQICVRNPNCINGFFMPRKEIDFREWLETQNRLNAK